MPEEHDAFKAEMESNPMLRALADTVAEFVNHGELGTRDKFWSRLERLYIAAVIQDRSHARRDARR